MAKIIEIRTQHCPRCTSFEPKFKSLQENYSNHEYKVLVFGQDPEAMEVATKYGIKSAPTFVIEQEDKEALIVKQEELEETIKAL